MKYCEKNIWIVNPFQSDVVATGISRKADKENNRFEINTLLAISTRASLNSSASHLLQTPPPFSDWLYADRLHAIDQ
ncbi:hypothetical protein T03_422 [Trichinella britovi]|uniref:Uncharacterized protein n=1 Tax=Trichinella britovi TaxID=45882 RepID=A0A0V1C1Z2_TRIBR|nr:hypothetical protein T03_422 [Trichinella britovi]